MLIGMMKYFMQFNREICDTEGGREDFTHPVWGNGHRWRAGQRGQPFPPPAGKVWDQGRMKELRTDFSTRSGELTGTYHVEDEQDGYDGTLTDFTPSGPCAGLFRWHDRYGDGVVQVDFRPDRDRFDGEWGTDVPLKEHIFNGRRIRPVPVS